MTIWLSGFTYQTMPLSFLNQLGDFINKNPAKVNFMAITASLTTLYTQDHNTKNVQNSGFTLMFEKGWTIISS